MRIFISALVSIAIVCVLVGGTYLLSVLIVMAIHSWAALA